MLESRHDFSTRRSSCLRGSIPPLILMKLLITNRLMRERVHYELGHLVRIRKQLCLCKLVFVTLPRLKLVGLLPGVSLDHER
jgi:hypothetical protein